MFDTASVVGYPWPHISWNLLLPSLSPWRFQYWLNAWLHCRFVTVVAIWFSIYWGHDSGKHISTIYHILAKIHLDLLSLSYIWNIKQQYYHKNSFSKCFEGKNFINGKQFMKSLKTVSFKNPLYVSHTTMYTH